jgi:Protein of unknown function (DUF3072)
MTDHHHPESQRPEPPTRKQQRYLRTLAQRTRQTFVVPRTKAQASAEIRRLERTQSASRAERRTDDRQVATALQAEAGGAARVREDELAGHGSTARWSAAPPAPEPTDAQLRYLRQLATRTRTPMPQPRTLAEASALITELRRRPVTASRKAA